MEGSAIQNSDILATFVKPQRLTEEEVMISKEKRICIVCKGKASGLMYVCLHCETIYYDKCSKALTESENACWVCNNPFDSTRPSHPFKEEEDEVTIIDELLTNTELETQDNALKSR